MQSPWSIPQGPKTMPLSLSVFYLVLKSHRGKNTLEGGTKTEALLQKK